jgi:general L-amino acid transport system substrate-binding protein
MVRRAALVFALCSSLLGCGRDEENKADQAQTTAAPPTQTAAVPPTPSPARESPTLRAVRGRGRLNCGVNPGLAGFAYPDSRGVWSGFDVDFCRATAVAVLGDRDAVVFRPLDLEQRFNALRAGEVDVLWRNTSHTLSRDAAQGLEFAGVSYYDGQGFMVRRSLGLRGAAELGGARVCVQTGSTSEQNAAEYFAGRKMTVEVVPVATDAQARAAYQREACDAYTADISTLASARSVLNDPAAHVILPDVISKEPLGPVVRQGDNAWADVVAWTLNAMILAEELGVTSKNVEEMRETSTNPEIRRLLGVEGGHGRMLGLDDDWAYQVIRQVGNYGEVFQSNLGQDSPLRLQRGLNALWNAEPPGLMYAPPIR